jgi:uncharacterized protein YlxP (DUF503 family)
MAEKSLSSKAPAANPAQWLVLGGLAVGLAAVMVYLSWPRVDYKAVLDRQITEEWMAGREVVDALEFFEKGGVYENRDSDEAMDIDQKYVVPLVKRLKDEFHLNVLAIVEPDSTNTAMAIVAEVPPDRETRNKIRAAILETADKFPGFAMQNWSHNYVSLDFLDELEITPLREAGALEPLRASQRMME